MGKFNTKTPMSILLNVEKTQMMSYTRTMLVKWKQWNTRNAKR